MRSRRQLIQTTAFFSLFLLAALPGRAHAYIDPGTGSYFLQLSLAAVFGAILAVKSYWTSIRAFFARVVSRQAAGRR